MGGAGGRMRILSLCVPALLLVLNPSVAAEPPASADSTSAEIPPTRPLPVIRDRLRDGGYAPPVIRIPPGEFVMGDQSGVGLDDEVPVHRVRIGKAFAIGKYEVTFQEYDHFAKATARMRPMDWGWGRGSYPVFHVSYFDAVAYTRWLSEQTGHTWRLPTEAEWEYAARGGTDSNYWWGDDAGEDHANCYDCAAGDRLAERTTVAGFFPANPFGLHDTQGNVFEWTSSVWSDRYNGSETKAASARQLEIREDHTRQPQIVMRGGAWNLRSRFIRSASRYRGAPQARTKNLGFRVVREVD